jgi:threonine dehydrogenase-like Zn-dependent dehydrogenase
VKAAAGLAGQPFPGEPLGCAMNIFKRADIQAGQTVAIVGIGFLGAILTRLATDAGARVIAISRRSYALDLARRMGAAETIVMDDHQAIIERVKALTDGRFCERVVEAVGKAWPLDLAGELTARARQADRRRLPPGRPAPGQYVAVELAGDRRDQRPRA